MTTNKKTKDERGAELERARRCRADVGRAIATIARCKSLLFCRREELDRRGDLVWLRTRLQVLQEAVTETIECFDRQAAALTGAPVPEESATRLADAATQEGD